MADSSKAQRTVPERPTARPDGDARPEPHAASAPPDVAFVSATHDVLFHPLEPRCDACGAPCPPDDDEGYGVPGRGVYVASRGDERRIETVPLCPRCAAAIGMTALLRWEEEEEEG